MNYDILYLHGFGTTNPESCHVARRMKRVLPSATIHTPCYHPHGSLKDTRIDIILTQCEKLIERSRSRRIHLVGYSFGGLLASLLSCKRDDLVDKVLLLAPAIDNYERNFGGRDEADWFMPRPYVEELRATPARPEVTRPTTLVHGMADVDLAGSAPWRIVEWSKEQAFDEIYLLEGVGHGLEPWLSSQSWTSNIGEVIPTFDKLILKLFQSTNDPVS